MAKKNFFKLVETKEEGNRQVIVIQNPNIKVPADTQTNKQMESEKVTNPTEEHNNQNKSNNWLKMHGIPMRRKSSKKTK